MKNNSTYDLYLLLLQRNSSPTQVIAFYQYIAGSYYSSWGDFLVQHATQQFTYRPSNE